MSDVPRPFKKMLPAYTKHEEQLLSLIYKKFLGTDLTDEEKMQLKQIDDDLLWYDLKELLGETSVGEAPEIHIDLDYQFRTFAEVEEEYLRLFGQLSREK